MRSRFLILATFAASLLPLPLGAQEASPKLTVEVVSPSSIENRMFLVLSKKPITGVFSQSWFAPEVFFAQSIGAPPKKNLLEFRPTESFPAPLADLPSGTYYAQAIEDRRGGMNALASAGNLFSKPQKIEFDRTKPMTVRFVLDQVVPERKFVEKPRVKFFEIESTLLSKFHNAPTKLRAGVVLPPSFAQNPVRMYPVVYEIPGFGGDHHAAFSAENRDHGGVDMIHVMLDPTCVRGHHVFADSANNGPVGQALVQELIPALEKTFHGSGRRFVTGHSSGGWSSLWLQITYPETFAGVWSTAPDSVDFRDFQKVNIYEKNANVFTDGAKNLRPIARRDGKTILSFKRFSDMEVVLGRGGQLASFEAVFSPRGKYCEPRKLWDRKTGAVDPDVAKTWQAYDMRLLLEKNWPTLEPKLKGKIHVFMGSDDTFFLDGATRLLKTSLEKLGSDAVVEIVPGRHHGNLVDTALRKRIGKEMADAAGGS